MSDDRPTLLRAASGAEMTRNYAAEREGYPHRHQPCGRPPEGTWRQMCPRAKLGWDKYLNALDRLFELKWTRRLLTERAEKTPLEAVRIKERIEQLDVVIAKVDALAKNGAKMIGDAKFRCPCTTPKCEQWTEVEDARGNPSGTGGWMYGAKPF